MKKFSLVVLLMLLLTLVVGQSALAQEDPPVSVEIVGYITEITASAIVVDGYAIPFNAAYDPLLLAVGDRVQIVGYVETTVIGEHFVVTTLAVVDPLDFDLDGVLDVADNCVSTANPLQEDADADGIGDVCDSAPDNPDEDADLVVDGVDNCPGYFNPFQEDTDGDGGGDACDPSNIDTDADGIMNDVDNCMLVTNADQLDTDADGVGDACQEVVVEEPVEEGCLAEGHPVATTLSEAFGVDYATISGWACDFGMGEIAKALLMADQVEFSDIEVILASAGELGWGEVFKAAGLSPSAFAPGQVISGRYHGQYATIDGEQLQLEIQVREQTELNAPGNSGNAPGHNRGDDAPGNSGNAPGQNRGDDAPGNSENAPGQIKKGG
jgi:hypothetical protein